MAPDGYIPLARDFRFREPVFSYKLRYIVGFGLVEMAISTSPKPMIYRNLCTRMRAQKDTFIWHHLRCADVSRNAALW